MATRQYIGARYTTKIYENSQDPSSAEWESGFSYEPLTLVTYQNSSYLSKKEVPANIGDPAANPQYWVITGAYNGQIAVLQQQIDALDLRADNIEDALDDLKVYVNGGYQDFTNRKFVFATDSWMNIINDYLVPMMGLTLADVTRISCSGGGFVQQNPDNDTFITKLSAQAVDENVTDFLVIGGQNDAYGNQSASDVETAMGTYFDLARTKYPNATFYFVPCQHITDTIAHALKYVVDLLPVFEKVCAEKAVKYYPNATYIINKISMVSGDRQHTSNAGAEVIATYLLNALIGADISVQTMEETTITTSTINGVVNAYIKTNNSFTEIMAGIGNTAGAWEFLTSKTIGDLVNTRNVLANIADVGGLIVNAWDYREMVPVMIVTGTGKYMTNGLFELRNGGDITMQLFPDMSSYASETIQYVQIMKPLYLTGNTYYIA